MVFRTIVYCMYPPSTDDVRIAIVSLEEGNMGTQDEGGEFLRPRPISHVGLANWHKNDLLSTLTR